MVSRELVARRKNIIASWPRSGQATTDRVARKITVMGGVSEKISRLYVTMARREPRARLLITRPFMVGRGLGGRMRERANSPRRLERRRKRST